MGILLEIALKMLSDSEPTEKELNGDLDTAEGSEDAL